MRQSMLFTASIEHHVRIEDKTHQILQQEMLIYSESYSILFKPMKKVRTPNIKAFFNALQESTCTVVHYFLPFLKMTTSGTEKKESH